MKPFSKAILSSALVVAFGVSIGCNSGSQPAKPSVSVANMQSVTFFVEGMI